MESDNVLIICRACGRNVLMHNMRPDADGEHMICLNCYKKQAGVKSATSIFGKKEIGNTPYEYAKSKSAKAPKSEKMVKYICTSCKYKFSRKESQEVIKCPYCGKERVVFDSALGADKILHEAEDKRFDW